MLIAAYLAAIAAANLLAANFGRAHPWVLVVNALVLIGLDLTCRDALHDRWAGRRLPLKMGALIAVGGLLSWAVQPMAGRVALASAVAFALAALADAAVYHLARRRRWLERVNASNLAGAAVDSIAFPVLAFGAVAGWVPLALFVAKVAGGALWALALRGRAREPAHAGAGR